MGFPAVHLAPDFVSLSAGKPEVRLLNAYPKVFVRPASIAIT